MLRRLIVAATVRLHEITTPQERDRGDSPVPTSIIIAGLALLAIAVMAWAVAKANHYMDSSPNQPAP